MRNKAYTWFQQHLLEGGVTFLERDPLMIEDRAAASSAISIKHIWKFPGNAVKGTDISCNFRKHFISPPPSFLALVVRRGREREDTI